MGFLDDLKQGLPGVRFAIPESWKVQEQQDRRVVLLDEEHKVGWHIIHAPWRADFRKDFFAEQKRDIERHARYGFEQHYVTAAVPGGIKLWPEEWTRHFRLHCLRAFPLRYFMPARLPRDAKIVTFPGGPNPGDVQLGRWSEQQPAHGTRLAHLRASFGSGRQEPTLWRHLTRYVQPVGWIREHWKE